MALDLIIAIHSEGMAVEVMTTQPSPDRRLELLPPDVPVWRLPALLPPGALPGAIVARAASRRPAVVHVLNSRIGLDITPALASLPSGPRVVCHLHGEEGPGGGYPPYAVRRHRGSITAFVVVSDDLADIVEGYGADPSRIHVVRPRVDLKRFQPTTSSNLDDGTLRVLLPARLATEKRPLLAIEAIEELIRRGTPATLTLAGDGPLRDNVMAAIAASPHSDAFAAPGIVNDMPKAYGGHDVVLLTSQFEASPLAIGEALASGVAVVAPRIGGIPELVGDCGVLVDDPTPANLAAALVRFADRDMRLRARSAGRERAIAMLGPHETTERLIEIHRSVAAGRAR